MRYRYGSRLTLLVLLTSLLSVALGRRKMTTTNSLEVKTVHDLGLSKEDFPLMSPGLRRYVVKHLEVCPNCSRKLGTGRCFCGFDRREVLRTDA